MKAKRILPLLAAAALLAGCFKDVSYKTNYVLKPLAQAQTVDPVEPFEGLKAYAFDADTAFYTVASYEDALNGVIARKDDLSDRIASPVAAAEPCVREGTVGWVQMPLSAETQMVVAVDPVNRVYAYTQQELDVNLPNLYVSLIFKPWKGFSYKEGNWSFYNEFYAPPVYLDCLIDPSVQLAEGGETEVFDGWFQAMGIKPRTEKKLAGYSSWYNRYQDITEDTIREDLTGCRSLLCLGDLFQIDDGWEPEVGDWLETDAQKFPHGLKGMVEEIHAAGFQAGLWLAPFVCEKDSALFRQHPDWLLKVDGAPWCCGCNWSSFYALDIDNPAVLDYLRRVFDRVLNDWDFDLVKLDFLYGAAPFGNARESRAARMYRAMELLRSWCGQKQILGCGVPVMPAFGLVDYCRVSCDVGLDWDDVWYMRLFHRERVSTKQAINNTLFRRQLNGRAYGSDPDVFFLREENCKLTAEQKRTLATVNALLGNVFLTSDMPSHYTDAQRAEYRRLRTLFEHATQVQAEAENDRLYIRYLLDGTPQKLCFDLF